MDSFLGFGVFKIAREAGFLPCRARHAQAPTTADRRVQEQTEKEDAAKASATAAMLMRRWRLVISYSSERPRNTKRACSFILARRQPAATDVGPVSLEGRQPLPLHLRHRRQYDRRARACGVRALAC